MLKYAAYAAAAIIAVPASAATVLYEQTDPNDPTIVLEYRAMSNDWDGAFRFRAVNTVAGAPNGSFTASYTFNSPIVGLGSATAGNVIVSGNLRSDLNFTSAFLNGTEGSVIQFGPRDAGSTAWVFDAPVLFGTNTLTFTGVVNPRGNQIGNALVTGSLTIAAVPEPATWALFILGFGAIGHTMRRRSGKVRVGKATLTFS